MKRATALVVAIVSLTAALPAQVEDLAALRSAAPVTILQINDVYSTAPVEGLGGLARVASLKQRVAAEGRMPLLVIAGDFLSSSVESTIFKGEQMVAALNSAGLDIATLGNHEFDFGVDVLLQRMREARWQWVVSNIVDAATNRPVGGASPYLVRTVGSLRIGFIGLGMTTAGAGREGLSRLRFIDPAEAAATYLPALKKEGADVIVALTHLSYAEDRALAERFPELDVILGGHEHFPIAAVHNRTLISKAGTEAKFVARIDLGKRQGAPVERLYQLIPITSALPDDPPTAAVVTSFGSRLGSELDVAVARAAVPLDGVTARVRTSETNLGNLVADVVRADADADVALVNSGGIRGDRVYGPGPITRRMLLEIHPFGNIVCKVAVPGRVLLAALNHSVSDLPAAAGQFPQVSGIEMRVDLRPPAGARVRNVRIKGEPLDPDRVYTVAVPDYVLLGGDGFTMFTGQKVLIAPESGTLLTTAIERYLAARDEVSPAAEGRIITVR
jgi:5'-nucleotidase